MIDFSSPPQTPVGLKEEMKKVGDPGINPGISKLPVP